MFCVWEILTLSKDLQEGKEATESPTPQYLWILISFCIAVFEHSSTCNALFLYFYLKGFCASSTTFVLAVGTRVSTHVHIEKAQNVT